MIPTVVLEHEDTYWHSTIWPKLRGFVAGYASGMALIAVGHPFDTVKVRLQTDSSHRFKGPIDCVKETFKKEGFRGFYKGVTPPLFATGVINSVMFGLQGLILSQIKDPSKPATLEQVAIAGAASGSIVSLIVAPIEGIKARLQVQYNSPKAVGSPENLYKGPIDCAKRVYKNLGLREGIYRGYAPTLFCRFSNYSYFGGYAFFRTRMLGEGSQEKLSLLANAMAGAGAGVVYWLSCYPMDVVKNRMQAAKDVSPPVYPTARDAMRVIYRDGGWKAFYAGFTPAIIRAVPANIACFSAFEIVMYFLPR